MPINFNPLYSITPDIARYLMQMASIKEKVSALPLTPTVLSSLRETAKLYTTHYSTMIEGNRLQPSDIKSVIELSGHFPGREREEAEVKGYYTALARVEQYAARKQPITEKMIQTLHALVMSDGRTQVKPSPYRDGQNVIRDGLSGIIVYMPPEAKDVSDLMQALMTWINKAETLPALLVAAIAHYQFATIHPYYDGNGRTARLLTTLILHLKDYDLKGLYSLEEYYAKNLSAYYHAISVGPSHNYYMGRAESDITQWIEYFCQGAAFSCNKVLESMQHAKHLGRPDHSPLMRTLDPKQRKVLTLFETDQVITSAQIAALFGFKPRTSTALCKKWVEAGFLDIHNASNKARSYTLSKAYSELLS